MAVSARRAQDRTPRVRLVTLPGVFAPITDSWLLARAVAAEVVTDPASPHAAPTDPRADPGPRPRVLDACTGSGVVGVSAARAGADVTSVDVSRRAVACAWLNARLNGTRLRARRGDLLAPVAGERFDVVAANPPYVPAEHDELPATGAARAWDAGRSGRAVLDRVLDEGPPLLAPGGALLVVHSDLIGVDETLARLRAAGLTADVAARERGPLGPLMRERRARGLLPPEVEHEEVLVLRGRREGARRARSPGSSQPRSERRGEEELGMAASGPATSIGGDGGGLERTA